MTQRFTQTCVRFCGRICFPAHRWNIHTASITIQATACWLKVFATWCLPHGVYHMVFATRCKLPHGVCHMVFTTWCLPYGVCHKVFITRCLPHGVCHMVFATWCLPHSVCHMVFATWCLPHSVCQGPAEGSTNSSTYLVWSSRSSCLNHFLFVFCRTAEDWMN